MSYSIGSDHLWLRRCRIGRGKPLPFQPHRRLTVSEALSAVSFLGKLCYLELMSSRQRAAADLDNRFATLSESAAIPFAILN